MTSKYLQLIYNVVKCFSLSVYLVVTKCEWTERVKLYSFGYMSHHHGEGAKTMRLFLTVVNQNRGGCCLHLVRLLTLMFMCEFLLGDIFTISFKAVDEGPIPSYIFFFMSSFSGIHYSKF